MGCKIFRIGAAIVAVACIAAAFAPPAFAIGYWNLPGNHWQWCGCGYGPGYHAPMVLGPVDYCCCGCFESHEVRLDCPPGPPSYCGYGARCGSGEYEQSLMDPVAPALMPAQPQPQPTPAAAAWMPMAR
jgi:hypothetical protein